MLMLALQLRSGLVTGTSYRAAPISAIEYAFRTGRTFARALRLKDTSAHVTTRTDIRFPISDRYLYLVTGLRHCVRTVSSVRTVIVHQADRGLAPEELYRLTQIFTAPNA